MSLETKNISPLDYKVIDYAKKNVLHRTYNNCFFTTFTERKRLTEIFGFKVNRVTELEYTLLFSERLIFIEKNGEVIANVTVRNKLYHGYDSLSANIHDRSEEETVNDLILYYRNNIFRANFNDRWYDR